MRSRFAIHSQVIVVSALSLSAIRAFALSPLARLSNSPLLPARLRACFKIPWGPVFAEKAEWRGATREHTQDGSVTEEQRSQAAFSAKTLRAAVLLAVARVGSPVTARFGDAPASPPWPQPKSLAAGPHAILKQALKPAAHLSPIGASH